MARYFDIHPKNPEPRAISQTAQIVEDGGVIAYSTDSGFALGCKLGNYEGIERIRRIRKLDKNHNFTLIVSDFFQLGKYVEMDNRAFRLVKAATPGPYTFILNATKEIPKTMMTPKKKTVGVRVPDNLTVRSLIKELGQPMLSATLILPGGEEPMSDGWSIKEALDIELDAVLDAGWSGNSPTTVVDLTGYEPEVVRLGGGDPAPFMAG